MHSTFNLALSLNIVTTQLFPLHLFLLCLQNNHSNLNKCWNIIRVINLIDRHFTLYAFMFYITSMYNCHKFIYLH